MFLKYLINPKPSIIIFFGFFCVFFSVFPLLQFDIGIVFNHPFLHPLIVLFLSIASLFFLSTGINNMIYEKNIVRKENLVIGVVFILLSSAFMNTVEAWISFFLLLFVFNFLLESYQKDLPFSQFYNASMILAIITFLFPSLFWLLFMLIIGSINYSNINWRIICTIILGFITPFLFYFVVVFLMELPFRLPDFFNFSWSSVLTFQDAYLAQKIWLVIFLLVVIFSFFELFSWLYKKSIKSRRTFITIIWFFIITTFISIFSGWQYLYFSILPLSIIIGNYFVYTKNKRFANVLFLLLVISSFYYKYMIIFNM